MVRSGLSCRAISSSVPQARSRPRVMMATRWQMRASSGRMWLVTISVLPRAARAEQQLPHLDPGRRVEPVGRLVEDEDRRVVQQGPGDGHPLLHPVAEALDVQVA